MASGTKFRLFSKLLDAANAPLWVISPSGRLAYLSAGCASWLGVEPESLIDRQSIAGAPVSDHHLDRLAASLSPPPGLTERGTASLKVQPPSTGDRRIESMEVRFVQVGLADQAITIAVGGTFADRKLDYELQDAVAIRQRLDAWRRQQDKLASIVTSGESIAAKRLRRRLQVAAAARTDIVFVGPPGCGSESIATQIHRRSAADEPLATVDGPLMDAELLEATLGSIIHPLTESSGSRATIIVRALDEMPFDAQQRLAELLTTFGERLRLLALCSPGVVAVSDPESDDKPRGDTQIGDTMIQTGVHFQLMDILSALTVTVPPLALRVQDLPTLATALVNQLRAAGETTADNMSRSALDALVTYPWPNNFDELVDAIRQAANRADQGSIGLEQLPLAVRSYRSGDNPAGQKLRRVSLDDAVAQFEIRLITEAIEATGGNRAEAARRLGISRARLLRKVDESNKQPSDP